MGVFSRLMNFFRIRTSAMLDKAEDPGQVMDYSYGKQRDETEVAAHEDSAPAAYVDTERHPKPKSYYKAQKEKAKKKG